MTKKINIKITKNEALVLFDFLSRFNQNDNIDFFEDKAEKILLWNIESELEKELEDILIEYKKYTDENNWICVGFNNMVKKIGSSKTTSQEELVKLFLKKIQKR